MNRIKHIFGLLFIVILGLTVVACTTPEEDPDIIDPVYTITLSDNDLIMIEEDTKTVVATVNKDGETLAATVTWESSNPEVATVVNGLITALNAGTTTIKASALGKEATLSVTVEAKEPDPVFLLVAPNQATLNTGETVELTVELTDGSNPVISWSSDNEAVATVDSEGLVTALSAGTAKITASSGDLSDFATITVKDTVELIFPVLNENYFVGDEVTLGVIVRLNGVEVTDGLEIKGEGFDLVDGKLLVTTDGNITVTASYPGTEDISRSFDSYIKVSTTAEFIAIGDSIESLAKNYMLTSDLDFEGDKVASFSSYQSNSDGRNFKGRFNGNGHSIFNIEPIGHSGGADKALFGYMVKGSIVENVNFINVIGSGRSAVVANYNLGGTIRNVFVEMTYVNSDGANANNPAGVIVGKNQKDGILENLVAVLHLASGVTPEFMGGIASFNYGTLNNVHLITNGKLLNDNEIPLFMLDGAGLGGEAVNSGIYNDVASFYAANVSLDASWTLLEGKLPHLGLLEDNIEITNLVTDLFAGTSTQIEVTHNLGITFELAEPVVGVTLSTNGLLVVSEDVPVNTNIEVIVSSNYLDESDQITFVILVNEFKVNKNEANYDISFIKEVSPEADYIKNHGITVLLNNEPYLGVVELISTNPLVASVDENSITALSAGTTTINIIVDGNTLDSITVSVDVWNPVRTTAEFLAIGDDKVSLSQQYILLNDLDFEGAQINSFSSWGSNNSLGINFSGHFDGNGNTIANFEPVGPTAARGGGADRSLFGYMVAGSTVENVNFIGVIGYGRSAVVSNYNLGGTIRNVYVEMTYFGNVAGQVVNNANPAGVIVGKNQTGGNLNNLVAVLTLAPGVTPEFMGGIASLNYGTMTNVYMITNGKLQNGNDIPFFMLDHIGNGGSTADSASFNNLSDFNAADVALSDEWTLADGKLPHVGVMEDSFEFTNIVEDMFIDSSLQLTTSSKFGVFYELIDQIAGVSLDQNGLLTVSSDVAADLVITIKASSLYTNDEATYVLTTAENLFEATANSTDVELTWIDGVNDNETVIPHGVQVTLNNNPYLGVVDFVSSNPLVATVDLENITLVANGTTEIHVKVNGNTLLTIIVTVDKWLTINTNQDFLDIGTNKETMSQKYLLMNDLDFGGAQIAAFSSWHSNDATKLNFSGHFNGNGKSISNFEPIGLGTSVDRAIFGYMVAGSVVENINFINVIGYGRTAVVSNYQMGGTIRNVYVEMTYFGNVAGQVVNSGNPVGIVAGKVQASAILNNIVVVLTLAPGVEPEFMGGIVSLNYGTINNAYLITSGTLKNGNPIPLNWGGTKVPADSQSFDTLDDFYLGNPILSDEWTLVDGKLPHVGIFEDLFTFNNNDEIFIDDNLQLETSSFYGVVFELVTPVDGVTITPNGLITVGPDVLVDTVINVRAYSNYTNDEALLTLTAKENLFVASSDFNNYSFDLVEGFNEANASVAHGVLVTLNDNPYTGQVNFESTNELVATVDQENILFVGEGNAIIKVLVNGNTLLEITVTVTKWNPITTTSEFLAIGTDKVSMSKKYLLMNDLDFEGAQIIAFSSYHTNVDGLNFSGHFNGNGFTISNFEPLGTPGRDDRAIFGYMVAGSVVENTRFTGVVGVDRTAVVSNYMLGGLIQNVYVEMTYMGNLNNKANAGNPAGTIVGKKQAGAIVKDVITVLTIPEGVVVTNLGGIASLSYTENPLTNTQIITNYEGTLNHSFNNGVTVQSSKYIDIETFLADANAANFDTSIWDFDVLNNTINMKQTIIIE